MALVICPDCGNELSDQAPACPKCGRPTARAAAPASKTTLTKPAGCFLQLLAIVVFVVGGGLCCRGGLLGQRLRTRAARAYSMESDT